MDKLPKCYTLLFNAVTDALALLEHGDIAAARALLITAQQNAEEAYLSQL